MKIVIELRERQKTNVPIIGPARHAYHLQREEHYVIPF
jgi:hypothetical protein